MNSRLDKELFDMYVGIIIYNFDIEITRQCLFHNDDKKFNTFLQFMLEQYSSHQFYTFFNPAILEQTVDSWFSNSFNRDFILSLTDKVNVEFCLDEISNDELCETLSSSICCAKITTDETNYSLLPSEIYQTYYINKETLIALFKSNSWLVILYLLLSNFENTQSYKKSIEMVTGKKQTSNNI